MKVIFFVHFRIRLNLTTICNSMWYRCFLSIFIIFLHLVAVLQTDCTKVQIQYNKVEINDEKIMRWIYIFSKQIIMYLTWISESVSSDTDKIHKPEHHCWLVMNTKTDLCICLTGINVQVCLRCELWHWLPPLPLILHYVRESNHVGAYTSSHWSIISLTTPLRKTSIIWPSEWLAEKQGGPKMRGCWSSILLVIA